ncbi:MAG TPA: ABC transporter substrate-binding protein [Candidatus Limnocylindrales bacterium]|jgi:NitT/TauT family transport system substrate-binding protein|nr:ABC transporter substrate-binding protein [Candidatus Limnocylindrales bacterium]
MKRSRIWLSVATSAMLVLAACGTQTGTDPTSTPGGGDDGNGGELTAVRLQLQWAPQAQFAGYFAARELGYYEDEGLDVTIIDGGPDVIPQQAGSAPEGPEFTISWVPKVLEARESGSDLVNIAQVFQRSGTLSVAWADSGITEPADFEGKRVGVWDFGNEFEVTAAARQAGLEEGVDYEKVIQSFDMLAFLAREIDVAEAMIYNEYAQVLEAENPETGELYQPEDMNVIDYNEVGTAMLQDAIFARAAWLAQDGNEDVAERFLRASFRGWIHCRDNPDDCIDFTVAAGSTLGAGHQAWMMNEINPLIWPSPDGIGLMDESLWQQTVDISLESGIISEAPPDNAYRTDLAQAALDGIDGDTTGSGFTKGTVEVTPGGE